MKTAALYARVSTQRQENEKTIDSQIDEIRARVLADGNILSSENIFTDEGWSGDILERPNLDKLRDTLKTKSFEILYVYDLGRLSRNFLNQLILIEEIRKSEIELISLHDINPENDEGFLARSVMGLFHDFERKKIAERFRRGRLYKAKLGKYMNLQPPYGYDYIRKTDDHDARLVINEEEADVVKKIFSWVANEKLTKRAVVKRLYEFGIPPKKRRRATWTSGPIGRLLKNESYIGKSYYNKNYAVVPKSPKNTDHYKRVVKSSRMLRPRSEWIEMKVPKILDEDIFDQVQEQIKSNKKFNIRNRKTKSLLPQKVFCICGRQRNIEGVREHRYYRCTDRIYRSPLPRQCFASGVEAYSLDERVWSRVLNLFTNENLIKIQAKRWMQSQIEKNKHGNDHVISFQKLIKKIEEEEARYVQAYGSGVLNLDQLIEKTKDLKQRRKQMETQMNKSIEVKSNPVIDITQIHDLPKRFSDMLQSLQFEEKQVFLRSVLDRVIVGDGRKVLVKGCIPLQKQIESEAQYNEFWTERRSCGTAKCGEVDTV